MKRALAAASVCAAAACSSGGGGGSGATPTPTPFSATGCQVLWATATGEANVYDAFLVDLPAAQWTTGTHLLAPAAGGNLAVAYYHLDLSTAVAEALAVATTGSISLDVAGLATGDSVGVTLPGATSFVDASGLTADVLATGGAGSFSGAWSDPSPDAPATPGSGTVAVAFDGSNLVLGSTESYALCYDANP